MGSWAHGPPKRSEQSWRQDRGRGPPLNSTDGPKVPGLEPIFRHLDDPDVPWQQVRSVRLSDGTVASVREKWSAFSADPLYLSLYRACLRTGP